MRLGGAGKENMIKEVLKHAKAYPSFQQKGIAIRVKTGKRRI